MNSYSKAGMATICATATLFTGVSFAAQTDKPGFHPSLSAYYISDNNIYRQATSKISDDILTVSPELLLIKASGKHRFTAKYNGNYASYSSNTSENYTDHFVSLDGMFDFSRKFKANLQVNLDQDHESRGSAGFDPATPTEKQNTWSENRLLGGFTFGRRSAKAQFEMDVTSADRDYTNNAQDARDRKSNGLSARVFYNTGPKSSVFIEAKQNTIDYINPAARNLDSKEEYMHLGFRWDIANKTTGTLKFGSFSKKFDSAAETDGTGSSYEASILWKPKTYSHVTLTLLQAPQESTTTDSYYTSSLMSVDWKHNLSSKLAFDLNLSSGTDDYSGTRKDTLTNASVGLSYKIRRSFELGLNLSSKTRDSSLDSADFDDGVYMLTAKWIKQ